MFITVSLFHNRPGAVQLNGTWERASQFQYQDSIGECKFI